VRGDQTEFHVTFTGASNKFGAAAATPLQLLNQNWASVYTVPQTTQNQLAFLTASANWNPVSTLSFQANAYYRGFWQHYVDGNGTAARNSDCDDPDFLCFPDLNGSLVNLTGLNGLPVPPTGVLANSILGEIDRTSTAANSFGGSVQAATTAKVLGHDNRFVIGASIDNGRVQFDTTSELGTINADQWPVVQGVGVYINQPSGDVAPVGALAKTLYTGVYATDTFDLTSRLSVTFGGRFNVAQIGLTDTLGNNEGLNGDHMYSRFNPVIGATFKITPNVTAYGGYAHRPRWSSAAPIVCGPVCSTMRWSAIRL
jgi:iron complex outermembrane recepter protein